MLCPFEKDGREMLDTELQRWHDMQVKREEALKKVEDVVHPILFSYTHRYNVLDSQAHEELMKCWRDWVARRNQLVEDFVQELKKKITTDGNDNNNGNRYCMCDYYFGELLQTNLQDYQSNNPKK